MNPDTQVAVLLFAGAAVTFGWLILHVGVSAWSERRAVRLAQEHADTLLAVEYFARVRELPDPDWSNPDDVEAHIAMSLALVRERMDRPTNVIQFPRQVPNGYRNVTRLPKGGA